MRLVTRAPATATSAKLRRPELTMRASTVPSRRGSDRLPWPIDRESIRCRSSRYHGGGSSRHLDLRSALVPTRGDGPDLVAHVPETVGDLTTVPRIVEAH